MSNTTFAVDDEFGNQITCGLGSYGAAKAVARRYLSAHSDTDTAAVTIYEDTDDGESWELSLNDDGMVGA